ncbi:hypothetical protein EVJ58_g10925, partial [Rhodofomes roseus]
MPSLGDQLAAALKSRDERLIRRRLPDPQADDGLADFSTNDYLSFATSSVLRKRFLEKLTAAPNARLARFFAAPTALLFNSGFDANVGFFSAVPQPGDAIVFDEHIHASVHDGMRGSRIEPSMRRAFAHNSVDALRNVLERLIEEYPDLQTGGRSAFLAVETLYSMDGTICPLAEMVEVMEDSLPCGNGYVVVDEAHATGLYGPQGRGLVALLGLENRVLARLHTFGKALAGTGAVLLTTPLIRDYLLNYARSLIYTTSLSYANIISVDCSFDLLEDGTAAQLANELYDRIDHFLALIRPHLCTIPLSILALPPHLALPLRPSSPPHRTLLSPIIPILTPYARPLSAHLRGLGLNAR